MKKILSLLAVASLVVGLVVTPVFAGGDKVQHERGEDTAPGPGDDARGRQVSGD